MPQARRYPALSAAVLTITMAGCGATHASSTGAKPIAPPRTRTVNATKIDVPVPAGFRAHPVKCTRGASAGCEQARRTYSTTLPISVAVHREVTALEARNFTVEQRRCKANPTKAPSCLLAASRRRAGVLTTVLMQTWHTRTTLVRATFAAEAT